MKLNIENSVDQTEQILEERVLKLLNDKNVPGLSLVLIRDNCCVLARAFGVTNTVTNQKMKTNTIFKGHSLTKPMSAIAGLRLCQEGVLNLDTPLKTCLQHPYKYESPRAEYVTLRTIISHTSGIPHDVPPPARSSFHPGSLWYYSSGGYDYLGHVIEDVTGEPIETHIKRVIFDKLNLDTSTLVWTEKCDQHACDGHNKNSEPVPSSKPAKGSAVGSLFTTSLEYANFMIAAFDDNSETIQLDQKLRQEVLTPQYQISKSLSWGLGWGLQHTGQGDVAWHWGGGGKTPHHNLVMYMPAYQAGFVLFTNSANGEDIWEDITALVLGEGLPIFPWHAFTDRWSNFESRFEILASQTP